MSLSNFLNPSNENDEPTADSTTININELIAYHTQGEDSDEEEAEIEIPSSAEVVQALEVVLRYHEHQKEATTSDIRYLQRLQRDINIRTASQKEQGTLNS